MNHHPRILAHLAPAGSSPEPCSNVSEQPCVQIIQTNIYTSISNNILTNSSLDRQLSIYVSLLSVIVPVHTWYFHCRNAGFQGHAKLELAGSYSYLPEGILH